MISSKLSHPPSADLIYGDGAKAAESDSAIAIAAVRQMAAEIVRHRDHETITQL